LHAIGKLPINIVTICVNKPMLSQKEHTLIGNRRLYFYYVRYLIERISWLARDSAKHSPGDGRCRLTFSRCGGLSYSALKDYLNNLKGTQTSVAWPHIDTDEFNIVSHKDSVWARAVDCIASGFWRSLELDKHGLCEDRYVRLIHNKIYRYNAKHLNYGVKVVPRRPELEKQRDNRYGWLSLLN